MSGCTRWWAGVKVKLRHSSWPSMIFTVAHLDTSVLLFLLTGMQTWIIVVNENVYTLRLAREPPVYLVGEEMYATYEWPWTKTVSRFIPYTLFNFHRRRTTLLGFQTALNWNTYCYYKRFSTLIRHVQGLLRWSQVVTVQRQHRNAFLMTSVTVQGSLEPESVFTSLKDVPTYAYISKRVCFKSVHSTNKTGLQNTQLDDMFLFTNAIRKTKSWPVSTLK